VKEYPKHTAVKQDFINLLTIEEFKEQALADLLVIYNLNDDKAIEATTLIDPDDPEKGWNIKTINNPMPIWKQKGFMTRQAVADLIIENGGEI
jgi:hypothetical protein